MDYITELFCILDDFCKNFNESLEKALISDQKISFKLVLSDDDCHFF